MAHGLDVVAVDKKAARARRRRRRVYHQRPAVHDVRGKCGLYQVGEQPDGVRRASAWGAEEEPRLLGALLLALKARALIDAEDDGVVESGWLLHVWRRRQHDHPEHGVMTSLPGGHRAGRAPVVDQHVHSPAAFARPRNDRHVSCAQVLDVEVDAVPQDVVLLSGIALCSAHDVEQLAPCWCSRLRLPDHSLATEACLAPEVLGVFLGGDARIVHRHDLYAVSGLQGLHQDEPADALHVQEPQPEH